MQERNYIAAIVGSALLLLSTTSGAWTVEENFDGQKIGDRCAPFFNDAADSTISNNNSVSGNNSCKMSIQEGSALWGGGFGFPDTLHEGDEVWVRFRLFIPKGFDFNAYSAGNALKFIRMSERNDIGTDGTSTVGRLDWYWGREGAVSPYALILERDKCSTNCWQSFGGANDGPFRGVWETYEMYAKFDHVAADNGGQGIVRAWKNGQLIGELTNRPTMWGDTTRILNVLIFSHWNGYSPATQHLYLDDLIATNVAPGSKDSSGNSYVGVGDFVFIAPPNHPLVK